MPIFKISDNLEKIAREVLRIQITVLGDCPQCDGTQYRSGVCEDCAYIAPEVLQAIQEWQESQGMEPGTLSKAAATIVDVFPQLTSAKRKKPDNDDCPRCKRRGFDLKCEGCGYEEPPSDLNHRMPEFTGPNPELEIRRRFIPSSQALQKIKDQKKKVKKEKPKKRHSFKNVDAQKTINKKLDNVNTVLDDATNRMHTFMLDGAAIEEETKSNL